MHLACAPCLHQPACAPCLHLHPCRITKPFTLLTIGVLVAQAVSGPVAAGFLAMNGLGGLHGWQW